MKYFTKDWYERTQVTGPMTLPTADDEAGIREWREYYRSEGRDYEEEQMEMFRTALPRLRKYVPLHLLELMEEGRLSCSVPPEHKAAPIRAWVEAEMRAIEETGRACVEHYAIVEPLLPPGARKLIDEYPLHDAKITAALRIGAPGEMYMLMDYTGALTLGGWCTLVFEGVQIWELPEDCVDYSWIYSEVYVPEPGMFELRALLYPRMGPDVVEIRIAARDVRIEEIRRIECPTEEEGWAGPGSEIRWSEYAKTLDQELGRQCESETERFRMD